MNRLFVIVVEVAGGWNICVDRVGWKGTQAIIEAIKIQVAYVSSRRRCYDIDCEVPTATYWRSGSRRKVIMPLSSTSTPSKLDPIHARPHYKSIPLLVGTSRKTKQKSKLSDRQLLNDTNPKY